MTTDAADGVRSRSAAPARAAALRTLLLGLYVLALCVGPRLDEQEIERRQLGVAPWEWTPPFGVLLNLDSFMYLEAARRPAIMLEPDSPLQGRPLLPLLAAGPVAAMSAVTGPAQPDADESIVVPYFTYLLLNFAMLAASLALFARAVAASGAVRDAGHGLAAALLPALGLAFACNESVRAFLPTPHTQLANLLAPLLALVAAQRLAQPAHGREVVAWSLGLGVAALGYAAFLAAGAVAWLALLHGSRRRVRDAAVFAIALVAPTIVWTLATREAGGGLLGHEVSRWREGVWLLDVVRGDGVGAALVAAVHKLAWFAGQAVALAAPALLACSAVALLARGAGAWSTARELRFGSALLVALAMLAFFTLVGLEHRRLATSIAVPLVVIAAAWACRSVAAADVPRARAALVAGWLLAIAVGVASVLADGPYA